MGEVRQAMYKTELVRRVARETGLSQRVVSRVLGASLDVIQARLATGEKITFPGFGTFYTQSASRGSGALGAHRTPGGGASTTGGGVPRAERS